MGLVARSQKGDPLPLLARATILATGGMAALWQRTTNPRGAVGAGLALAHAAGAALADLEFMQFHPTALRVEGPQDGFLITEAVRGEEPAGTWTTAGTLAELSSGGTVAKTVAGERVLFVRIEETFYAYRDTCPGCHESLEEAPLRIVELTCAACGHRYDVIRAGRCLDEPELYLEPVPLLTDDSGLVKVALRSAVA